MKWATLVGNKLLVSVDAQAETLWNPRGVSDLDQGGKTSKGTFNAELLWFLETEGLQFSYTPEFRYSCSHQRGEFKAPFQVKFRPKSPISVFLRSFLYEFLVDYQPDLPVLAFLTSHSWQIPRMGTSLEASPETKLGPTHWHSSPTSRQTHRVTLAFVQRPIFPSVLPSAGFHRNTWGNWHSPRPVTLTKEGAWKCFVTVKHWGRLEALLLL